MLREVYAKSFNTAECNFRPIQCFLCFGSEAFWISSGLFEGLPSEAISVSKWTSVT